MEEEKAFAWAVVNKENGSIMDDGVDDEQGNMLVCYPVFKKKSDAVSYRNETYGEHRQQFAVAKVLIQRIPTNINT